MKMNRKYTTILTVAVASLLACGLAAAQTPQTDGPDDTGHDGSKGRRMEHRGRHEQMGSEQMVRMMTRRLDLNETQTEQIHNIMEAAKPEFDALRDRGMANREATRNLDVEDPDYGVKLQDLSAASGELAASAAELRGRVRAEIHAILTPEQREKLEAAPERGRHRGARHQPGDVPQAPTQ
jgi:Spy/CpxP family protein refolding chaperone